MKLTDRKLEDTDLFLVEAEDGRPVATFRWRDASRAKPPSGKHMELNILPQTVEDALSRPEGAREILLPIYSYVFNRVLELTHQLSEHHMCKIHSDNVTTRQVYRAFAKDLGSSYEVDGHGNWIYISKVQST